MFSERLSVSSRDLASGRPERYPLPALIVYDDEPSYWRAFHALLPVIKTGQLRPVTWRFDSLATSTGRALATLDLASAQIFVLSLSTERGLPPAVEGWLKSAMGSLHGTSGTILALFGKDERADAPRPDWYRLLQRAALAARWDFFAPTERCPVPALSHPAELAAPAEEIATADHALS